MCVTKPLTDLLCLVMCTNYKLVVHPTWHSRSVSGIVISVPNLSMRHESMSFLVCLLSFFKMPMIKTCCGTMCVTKLLMYLVCL